MTEMYALNVTRRQRKKELSNTSIHISTMIFLGFPHILQGQSDNSNIISQLTKNSTQAKSSTQETCNSFLT